jgi:oligopeptide transport system substrate-binding protein
MDGRMVRRNRRSRGRAAATAAVLLALAVASLLAPLRTATVAAQGGGVLRVHQTVYPDVLDPQVGSALSEIAVFSLAYEALTRLDENLQTVPAAAERWEFNADLTEITFTLREGLTYADGTPLTAADFRYAAERTCDPFVAGGYQYVLSDIVVGCAELAGLNTAGEGTPVAVDPAAYEAAKAALGVEAVDERTLRVRLLAPAPYFPTVASLWVFHPVKRDLVEAGGPDWWRDPANHVGNGPFRVTRIDEQQLVAFEPNPAYWAGQPQLAGIEYLYIPDATTALEAYRQGQVDVLNPDPAQLPAIERDPALAAEIVRYPSANTWYLNFDLKQAPFDDPLVRQAFALAFDRQTFCDVLWSGTCVPTLVWVPADVPGAIETDRYAFDPEAARQTLAASSYGGPEGLPEIRYFYNSDDPLNQARAEWVAGQFRDILGVELRLEPTEGTSLSALRRDPATYPQLSIYNWYQDYPDPQNWLSVYWACSSMFAQRVGYCNEAFDEMVRQGDTTADPARRPQFYRQASTILLGDLPGAPLFHAANVFLVKPTVTGYAPTSIDGTWPGERSSLLTVAVAP